ncbi:MAG: hypothetical protein IPN69_01125 [Acidobacteria bacterium]|nr:hypothetical protein [Acidobacteriota bacterium]MBK8150450.1 hypothetical protein [Acidobacteriota bacterium]MBK8809321.1 hypothetical protein [Acidobacteriota bacterium]
MKVLKSREIVIEFERVQLIRKRARTQVVRCAECRSEADFVTIGDAAELFNTEADRLTRFVAEHRCHIQTDSMGGVFVCVGSLLAKMRTRADGQTMLTEGGQGEQNDRI